MKSALAVFAKRPVPGQVKTRLTPALSPESAASLYWAMVEDTWALASELPAVELHIFIDQPWEGSQVLARFCPVQVQVGPDLGSRMHHCLQLLTGQGHRPSIIIGTDSPTLPVAYIQAAFSLLEDENDAVLGPAEDGGYYLVGCRRPQPAMFEGVSWSSSSTLAETRSAFDAAGYRTRLTSPWRDVDSIEDLRRLAAGPVGPAVAAWLRRNPL